MKKQVILSCCLLIFSVILSVISYVILPETVVTQISLGNANATTMPKLIAILIPLALGAGGAVASILKREDQKNARKMLIVSGAGIVVFALMLIVNR